MESRQECAVLCALLRRLYQKRLIDEDVYSYSLNRLMLEGGEREEGCGGGCLPD